MDVTNHADDFRRLELILHKALHVDGGFLAEGIDSVQIFVHESLTDDRHVLFLGQLLGVEKTARAQGDVHGAEIVRPDNADVGNWKILERLLRLAEEVDASGRAQPAQWTKASHAGGATAGNGTDSAEKLLEESHAQLVRTVFGAGKHDLEGQKVAGIKSRINVNQADEAANEQAGAGEQDESQAQLCYHEGIAREGAAVCGGGAAAPFLEVFRDSRMCRDVGRQKAEEQSGEKRCGGGKGKNTEIHRYRMEVEEICGAGGQKSVGAPNAECDADPSADQREKQAFHQQLARDAPAGRTNGRADCHLAFATRRAGQEQAGDICAGNQQNESNRAE